MAKDVLHKDDEIRLKKIRLKVARRYLRRYGGELTTERKDGLNIRGYRGTPSEKTVPYTLGVDVYLNSVNGNKIAQIKDVPKKTGYFFPLTGAFKQEIPY